MAGTINLASADYQYQEMPDSLAQPEQTYIRRIGFAPLALVLLLLSAPSNLIIAATSIYFIEDDGSWCKRHQPCPTKVFSISGNPATLLEMQSLDDESEALFSITVEPECGLVVMRRGLGETTRLLVASAEQPFFQPLYETSAGITIGELSIWSDLSGDTVLQVQTDDAEGHPARQFFFTPDGRSAPQSASSLQRVIGEDYPTALAKIDETGQFQYLGSLAAGFPPKPADSLLAIEPKQYWSFVVSNEDVAVFAAVADRHGLTERALLVYDREQKTWNVPMIPGAETWVGYWPGWLAGTVAHSNPNADFAVHRGGAPVRSDSAVFINLTTMRPLTAVLGPDNEILWIAEDTVYYRSGENLYKGRIGASGVKDRQPLLTDSRVKDIHWAFRSESNP